MHPPLGLGLELATLRAPQGSPTDGGPAEDLFAAARAAAVAGADTVWIEGPSGPDAGVDAVTLAAGAAAVGPVGVGVRLSLDDGRHPSMVARELTALDLVSGGRAVLALRAGGPPDEAAGRLAEAVAICRGLFAGGPIDAHGPHYRVRGALNRPGPSQPGGPLALVEPGPGARPEDLAVAVALAAGVLVGGDEADVAAWRRHLGNPADGGQLLVWRGPLGGEAEGVADRTARLVEAGADAIVVPAASWSGDGGAGRVAAVRRSLGAPWSSPAAGGAGT